MPYERSVAADLPAANNSRKNTAAGYDHCIAGVDQAVRLSLLAGGHQPTHTVHDKAGEIAAVPFRFDHAGQATDTAQPERCRPPLPMS